MFRYLLVIFLVFAGLSMPLDPGFASPANGTFIATQTCDAYVSKNKHTNPDHYRLSVAVRYDILEATTGTDDAVWYRVRVTDARPEARWVEKSCGIAATDSENTLNPASGAIPPGLCNMADKGNSYVLAVSWQPAFCISHENKPECAIADRNAYQANHFTLHGLWPNLTAQCGIDYGYCGSVKTQARQFCDYPQVDLSQQVRNELAVVMPSVAAGSCLERHEWHKHGICQSQWNASAYFKTAIEMTKQFNDSGIAALMAANTGKTISQAAFISTVDASLGANAHEHLHLTCKNGKLVDIFIDLPEKMTATQKLRELIAQATPARSGFSSNCNGQFGVQSLGEK
ncbi:ribonuclease T [Candidatus Methylospira mobilis]|nr:ribonuclease T [Candidatus Methylospira mobilis]WNV03590.1 ribonuclease T [Candidatus Methylospira mobilis]